MLAEFRKLPQQVILDHAEVARHCSVSVGASVLDMLDFLFNFLVFDPHHCITNLFSNALHIVDEDLKLVEVLLQACFVAADLPHQLHLFD